MQQQHKETIFSLTEHEMSIVKNTDFLLTRKKITNKVCSMFGNLAVLYETQLQQAFPQINTGNAKISKGENYKDLPYIMLDYPRIFGKENIFAIRCFFWWGNFFSITLHLSGKYLQQFITQLQKADKENLMHDWYINKSNDQWQHHFEADNYQLAGINGIFIFREKNFIKLAKKIPFDKWDVVYDFYDEQFRFLLKILSHHAPIR